MSTKNGPCVYSDSEISVLMSMKHLFHFSSAPLCCIVVQREIASVYALETNAGRGETFVEIAHAIIFPRSLPQYSDAVAAGPRKLDTGVQSR